jgi:hypothetical protein
MHQKLLGYEVEEKIYLGVLRRQRLNITALKRPDRLQGPSSLLCSGSCGSFSCVKQSGRETSHSFLNSALDGELAPRLRISGAIPLLRLYAFMAWTGKTYLFTISTVYVFHSFFCPH